MKNELLKSMAIGSALLFAAPQAFAQVKDVTSTYIVNPSFEDDGKTLNTSNAATCTDIKGWTATASNGSQPNNFQVRDETSEMNASLFGSTATPTDGKYYYYYRQQSGGWGDYSYIYQKDAITLPQGHYQLTVDYMAAVNNTPSSVFLLTVRDPQKSDMKDFLYSQQLEFAANPASNYFSNSENWKTMFLNFDLSADKTVNLGVHLQYRVFQTFTIIDNFRLLEISDWLSTKQKAKDFLANNTLDCEERTALSELSTAIETASFNSAEEYNNKIQEVEDAIQAYQDRIDNKVTVNFEFKAEYGTLILPFDATVPEGMEVFTCGEVNGTYLTLNPVTSIQANVPYLVKGTKDASFSFKGVNTATADSYEVGNLTGVYATTAVPQDSYVLQNQDGKLGFYKVASDNIKLNPNRCYFTPNSDSAVKAFFFDGDATSIQAVESNPNALVNVYTVAGTLVRSNVKASEALNGLAAGVYVVGGNKKMVK